ncbi:MAG: WYL domain-containing protein, partial [Desulfovibrionaceae bacterium]|nr:WYL domain-containing protein [Desulfovibrionaceae bacterium]
REMQAGLGQMALLSAQGSGELGSGIGASLSKGRIDYGPFQEIITTLLQAIHSKKVCTVRYRSANGTEKEYDFAPMRFLVYRESLYAEGWHVTGKGAVECLYDDATRLAVHRLKSCVMTRRGSEKLPEPPAPGNEAFGFMEGEPFSVKIRFAPAVAAYVSEREWSREQRLEQHEDGSVTLEAQMFNVPECVSWVLSFGGDAEVLEPQWLRKEVKKVIGKMRKCYAMKTNLVRTKHKLENYLGGCDESRGRDSWHF